MKLGVTLSTFFQVGLLLTTPLIAKASEPNQSQLISSYPINSKSLIIFDSDVPDKSTLVQGVPKHIAVINLSDGDTLLTLQSQLSSYRHLNEIHLVTHGQPGQLNLLGKPINVQTLNTNPDIALDFGRVLANDGDLLLYGCRVGQGKQGAEFIDLLSQLSGADVAASIDDTGSESKGHDWELERYTGEITASLPFYVNHIRNYQGTLATPADQNYDSETPSLRGLSFTLNGVTYEQISPTSQSQMATISESSTFIITPNAGDLGVLYNIDNAGSVSGANVGDVDYRFKTADGEEFKLESMEADMSANALVGGYRFTLTITGYRDGASVVSDTIDFTTSDSSGSVTYSRTAPGNGGTLTFDTDWSNIDEVRFTGGNNSEIRLLMIDDLDFSAAVVSANNAPTVSGAPSDITVIEDTAGNVDLSAVTFADADGDILTVTLTASAGTFSTPVDGSGLSVTEILVNSTTITLAGTAANINTYLDTASNISYTGVANAAGNDSATLTIAASDGQDGLSSDPVVNIDITSVNDEPTLSIGSNQTAGSGTGGVQQSVNSFASMSDDGDTESAQSISDFIVSEASDTNNVVSSVDISNSGQLTYTPASSVEGTATINVQVQDDGGVANSGDDISQVSQFTITVDTLAPVLGQVTAVSTLTNDSTPSYTLSTNEAGTLLVGGSCGSDSEGAVSSGNVTINLTQTDNSTPLTAGTYSDCTVTVTDSSGNTSSQLSISSFTLDLSAPSVQTLTPTDNATGISNAANLTMDFDEDIAFGTGNITIHKTSDDSTVSSIDVTSHAGQLGISNDVLTINPSSDLPANTELYVLVDATAIDDLAGNSYSGIASTTSWSFTTADVAPPSITGITITGSPAQTATSVTFIVAFNENANNVSTDDFELTTTNTASGNIASVSASSGNSINVTVNTLAGEGTIRLDLKANTNIVDDSGNGNNTNGYVSAYTSGSSHTADLEGPLITGISIPNSTHKVGDTITATLTVRSDTDDYTTGSGGISGTIDGYTLGSLSKTNDTTYTASFTITDGGTDVAAASDVAVNVTLTDSLGNAGSAFTTAISQAGDAIYANLPDISLSADTNTIAEDGGVSTLSASISGSLNNQWPDAITVNLSYSGTATVTTDYTKSNSITINAGSTSGTSTVTGVADSHYDAAASETVIVDIASVSIGSENGTQQETISITDGEATPTVTLSVGSSLVAENGGTSTITATLNNATYADVTVNLAYSGTATSASDYSTPSTSITITGGTTSANATTGITGLDDVTSEGDETIIIDISSVSGGSASENGTQQQIITITDDDDVTAPTLSSSNPADGSSSARYDTDLELTFDETVIAGSGGDLAIAIYDADDDSLVESNDSDSGRVSISGAVVTVDLATDLASMHNYYVQIGADAIEDSAGNSFAGINDKTTLNFTTTNVAPVAVNDSKATNEDNAVSVRVIDNDTDADGTLNAASVTVVSNPSNGSTSVDTGSGVITYTPTADFNGSDSFTYTVEDNHSQVSNTATVTITVNAQNDAPVAVADLETTNEDTLVSIDVAANDTDIDTGDAVDTSTIVLVSQPSDGSAVVNAGKIDYTPDANFNGTDTFTYTIEDGNGSTSNTATVTVNVTSVNDLPVAANDTTTVDEDSSVSIDVLDNDSDVDGTLTATSVTVQTTPSNGSTSVNAVTGEITYTPTADFNGSDSFTYTVMDNDNGTSNAATVAITVTSINDAPTVVDDTVTLVEDTAHTINALGNDSDVDGTIDVTTVEIVTAPESGTTSVDSVTGAIVYTPNDDFNGSDSLTYRVQDDALAWSSAATVSLTVTAVNDAPLANNDTVTTFEDESLVIEVLSNDSDVDGQLDTTAVTIQLSPTHGNVTDNGDGSVTYTPTAEYSGSDSFSYLVQDDEGANSNVATVSITVTEVNDTPMISGTPSSSVLEGASYSFTPTLSDAEGDSLTVTASNLPAWLSLNAATGNINGTPGASSVGSFDGIVLRVSDGNSSSDLTAFAIEVLGDNDRDSIADNDDLDDDNDGMTDEFELANNLNPLNANDAALDSDGDGLTNLEEAEQGSNPQVDDQAPQFDVLPVVNVNATGLLTVIPELNTPVAVDALDGEVAAQLSSSHANSLAPGRYQLTWTASDAAGNQAESVQVLNVHPQISLSKDQTVGEGVTTRFRVLLNGQSPTYPLTVPFDVTGSADSNDHNLVAGNVTFEDGETAKVVTVNVIDDGVQETRERINVTLSGSGNLGVKQNHIITIVEENVAPQLEVMVNQNGQRALIVTQDGGPVDLVATINDPNPNDQHTLEWTVSGDIATTLLSDLDLRFDPAQVEPGLYRATVRASDNGAPVLSNELRLSFVVIPQSPNLSSTQDSDGDGMSDADEGLGDGDQDGQPDYLDAVSLPNVLNEAVEDGYRYLIEGDPGVRMTLGQRAIASQNGGAKLDNDMIPEALTIPNDNINNSGGYFDFMAIELPEIGQSVNVVIPQRVAIPENAIYRKFDGVWFTFVEDANNAVMSAPGAQGACPPPQSSEYRAGLNAGDWCVQLTIEDGGPNDADGLANGAVEDPGGVGNLQSASISSSGSGGGSVNWGLLLLITSWILYSLRRKQQSQSTGAIHTLAVCLVLFSFHAEAEDSQGWMTKFQERGYIEMGFYQATSSQSRSEFSDSLDSSGVTVDLQEYDTDRVAYNLSVGYRYLDWSAVEVGFMDLGDVEVAFDSLAATQDELEEALNDHYPVTGHGWTIGNRFEQEVLSRWSVSGELGVFFWNGDIDISGASVDSEYDNEQDLYVGFGSHYQILDSIAVGAKWRRVFVEGQKIDLLGGSLVLSF